MNIKKKNKMAIDHYVEFLNYVLNSDLKEKIDRLNHSGQASSGTIYLNFHQQIITVTLQNIIDHLQFGIFIIRNPYPLGNLFGEINKEILYKSLNYDELSDFLPLLLEELRRLDEHFIIH